MAQRLYLSIDEGINHRFRGPDRFAYKKRQKQQNDILASHGISLLEFDYSPNDRTIAESKAEELSKLTGLNIVVREYNDGS